jgi:hypothetical protein
MISIENEESNFFFRIGKHQLPIEQNIVSKLASALTIENVYRIAMGDWEIREGEWLIEQAHDDPSSELRDRILLHVGTLKWHITQEEAIYIGKMCIARV